MSFANVQAKPLPVQRPHPEVVFGGHTEAAYERAARLASGWYGFALDVEKTSAAIDGVRAACAARGRPFEDFEISVTPAPERRQSFLDLDHARRYADLGVGRLILYAPRARDETSLVGAISEAGEHLVGKV